MDKGKFIGLFFLVILLLSACKSYQVVEIPKNTTIEITTEEQRTENTSIEQPSIEEQTSVEQTTTNFELFNPDLTYPNIYNGPLYATEMYWNTTNINEGDLFTALDANGINYMLLLIPIDTDLNSAKTAIQNHPSRILPIVNPGFTKEELQKSFTASTLPSSYESAHRNARNALETVTGLGVFDITSLGIDATNNKINDLYNYSMDNNLILVMQLNKGEAQRTAMEELVKEYPEVTFLFHIDPAEFRSYEEKYTQIIQDNKNVYVEIDANDILYNGNKGLLEEYDNEKTATAINDFVKEFDSSYQTYVNNANARYEMLIETAPNQIVWGISLGPGYNYDSEVYNRVIKASRTFIQKISPEKKEDFAYKNALSIFGEGNA